MDWANERYVRLYTRDTDDWLCLSFEAQSLWCLVLRKLDRAGVLETKRGARGVAALVRGPVDVVERALTELLTDGCLVEHPRGYLAPNFIEAQETSQSDPQRTRESRARRADLAKLGSGPQSRNVSPDQVPDTKRVPAVTNRDEHPAPPVENVTPDQPDLIQTGRAEPASRAIPPTPAAVRARGEGWTYAAKGYTALQLEGIEPDQPSFPAMPVGTGRDLYLERFDEVLESAAGDPEEALALIMRRVDYALAECRRDRTVGWAAPSLLWRKDQFWKATERSPESAARPRSTGNTAPVAHPRDPRNRTL